MTAPGTAQFECGAKLLLGPIFGHFEWPDLCRPKCPKIAESGTCPDRPGRAQVDVGLAWRRRPERAASPGRATSRTAGILHL